MDHHQRLFIQCRHHDLTNSQYKVHLLFSACQIRGQFHCRTISMQVLGSFQWIFQKFWLTLFNLSGILQWVKKLFFSSNLHIPEVQCTCTCILLVFNKMLVLIDWLLKHSTVNHPINHLSVQTCNYCWEKKIKHQKQFSKMHHPVRDFLSVHLWTVFRFSIA